MAERKTVTRQTITGEAGIALIQQRALEMGYLFHPRRVDHGIDGHLDLVDPASKALLNSTVLVQSKASERPFSSETAEGFHYLCDPRDLDLWLGGNAPVIVVFSHPSEGLAWWVDVKAAFPDAVARASRRVDVVKARDAFDRSAAAAFLQLGVPRASGLYLSPPPRKETIDSNLLEVLSFPEQLFLVPAVTGSYSTAGKLLGVSRGERRSAWMLKDGMLISFADLRDRHWEPLRAGDVEVHDSADWASSDDPDVMYPFIDLLTRTVQNSYPELRWHRDRRHVHFAATRDLRPRKAGRGSGSPGRTVFGAHGAREDGGVGYYHHAAAELRFRRVGARWVCQINPDWCFTTDGRTPSPRTDSLTAGIKRLERHPAVAGWVRMWATFLRGREDLFSVATPVTFGERLTVDVDHGIDDRHWGASPLDVADGDDPMEVALDEPAAINELAAALFGEEDLDLAVSPPRSTKSRPPHRANRRVGSRGHAR